MPLGAQTTSALETLRDMKILRRKVITKFRLRQTEAEMGTKFDGKEDVREQTVTNDNTNHSNYKILSGHVLTSNSLEPSINRDFRRPKRSFGDGICDARRTVHGGWSPWSTEGSHCNATCGGGKMFRIRSCTKPIPQVLQTVLT